VIVTGVFAPVVLVVMANVPLVLPAAMVMFAGTVATVVFELESVMMAPPVPAGAVSVIVPVGFMLPPTTFVGRMMSVSTATAGRVIVSVAVTVP
jgi:hypothetical protein